MVGIKTWWQKSPRRTRWTIALGTPAALLALVQLVRIGYDHWTREHTSIVVSTQPNLKLQMQNVAKEDLDALFGYDYVTIVDLPNETSKPLKSVIVRIPKKGHVAVFDQDDKVVLFQKAGDHVRIETIPPECMFSVAVWHTDPWKLGDRVMVSDEEFGKTTIDPLEPPNVVSFLYAWGFWLLVLGIIAYTIRRLLGWRWPFGTETGPTVAAVPAPNAV